MALLAESLVEEWLNREGFFTIRGIKTGVDEIDLLGISTRTGQTQARHVESQVSFRPIGYISPLSKELSIKLGVGRTSARQRTDQELQESVEGWVEKKFTQKKKVAIREKLAGKKEWQLTLVHGVVREPKELEMIAACGIELVPFDHVLSEICIKGKPKDFGGAAGTDIAEMIQYFSNTNDLAL